MTAICFNAKTPPDIANHQTRGHTNPLDDPIAFYNLILAQGAITAIIL